MHSDTYTAIGAMLDGQMPEAEAEAYLLALRERGETASDILGAVEAVRERALPFSAPANCVDVCGTGGDGKHTKNISTASAFVASACGVSVVKHGNRAVSSLSGASDVLGRLGIPSDLPTHFWEVCAREIGLAFLHAPRFHPGLVRVAPLRQRMGGRTLFNLLGPLCNPARPTRQVIGVYSAALVPVIAEVAQALGHTHSWVVHGEDGGDEISISAPTLIAEIKDGQIETFSLSPEELGFPPQPESALRGGGPAQNAEALEAMLEGRDAPYALSVICNAGAALLISGKAGTYPEAMLRAGEVIASGEALAKLQSVQQLVEEFTHAENA